MVSSEITEIVPGIIVFGWFCLNFFLAKKRGVSLIKSLLWSFIVSPVIVTIYLLVFSGDKNRRCAWCNHAKIKFKSGEADQWHWKYRNKDGSKDKRVRNNFQIADYLSHFLCNKCGAETQFTHYVDKNPSIKIKVWKRTLIQKGTGDRKGADWESHGEGYSRFTENRKNK